MSIRKNSTLLFFVLIIGAFLYVLVNNPTSKKLMLFFIVANVSVITMTFQKTIKYSGVFSLINMANAFLLMIFVVRPLQIFLFPEDAIKMHAFKMYSVLSRYNIDNIPLAQASFIGFLGIYALNIFYKPVMYPKAADSNEICSNRAMNMHQIISLLFICIVALASEGLYVFKSLILSSSIHIYDLMWVYIFSVVIMYIITIKKEANIFIYLIILNCIVVLGISARRQYIVNLLLFFIVPLYYAGKNKDLKKILLACILLIFVVIGYGYIRRTRIGYETGGILFELMDEFCMFDMLSVSLDYSNSTGIGLFWGYNYLTIFTEMLPFFSILPFDHMFTGIVFNNIYHGAIPTSLCGSLFFNFSYIGVIIGMTIFSFLLDKIQNSFEKISISSVGYYTIAFSFVYDVIRVGDIGREFWTMMVSVIVFSFLKRTLPEKQQI
ncbi:O-antigen polymerase [Ruminococcus sp.]|uniref:O-antigen polymerase n=1 Tax=Ruminococcus sp. TaxID=41978 RepID=UPI0025CCB4C2|nr:O-antigen polymerase [Ruminococcus sp.]